MKHMPMPRVQYKVGIDLDSETDELGSRINLVVRSQHETDIEIDEHEIKKFISLILIQRCHKDIFYALSEDSRNQVFELLRKIEPWMMERFQP